MTTTRDYLTRIHVAELPRADAIGLRALHEAHLSSVPFENLSIGLGEPIELDESKLLRKIVGARRGGFCYELNGAFAWLLRRVGFAVQYLEARPFSDGDPGPPFDHMALRVDLEEPFLADVGFGDNFFSPLLIEERGEQIDRTGVYQLVPRENSTDLDLLRDGEPQFRLSLTPHNLSEFREMCAFHQTSPDSHFTQANVCSIPTATGRITVKDRTLITTTNGQRTERVVESDAELRATLADSFGIQIATS